MSESIGENNISLWKGNSEDSRMFINTFWNYTPKWALFAITCGSNVKMRLKCWYSKSSGFQILYNFKYIAYL